MKKTILIICLAAIVGLVLFSRKEKKGPSSVVHTEEYAVTETAKPRTLDLPYATEGLAWRTRVAGQIQSGERWLDNCNFVVRYNVVEADPREGTLVSVTFEDCNSSLSDTEYAGALNMKGRQFECRLTLDGRVDSLGVRDGRPLGADDLRYFIWVCDLAYLGTLFSPKTPVSGDQWTRHFETRLPGSPGSSLITDSTSHLAGRARRDGVEVGVIHTVSRFQFQGNVPLRNSRTPNQTVIVSLTYADVVVEGDSYINLQSGRPVARQDAGSEKVLKARVTSYAKGRRVPVQEEVVKDKPTTFRHSSEVEYLQ